MTELDDELGPLAVELYDEYGKELVYTAYANSTYDPATGTSQASSRPFTVKGTVEDYSSGGIGNSNGLIETGDKKITVAALNFDEVPSGSDTFEWDGSTYTVVRVKTTYSGELPALYEIQARQ